MAFAATAVRWVLVAVVHRPVLLVALQATHALTFGVFWGAALAWLGECVPPRLRATGQTMFTGVHVRRREHDLGMLGTGALDDAFGGADSAFLLAGVLELVPLVLVATIGRRLDPLNPAGPR